MVWIRVDVSVTRHPKLQRFSKAMGMSRHEGLGVLVDLWSWAVEYSDDGDLSKYTSEELVMALNLQPTNALIEHDLLQALEDAGLVDRDNDKVQLHDWDAHQGQLMAQRERSRERQRRYAQRRKEKEKGEDVSQTSPSALDTHVTNERNKQTNKRTVRPADRHDDYKVLEFENLTPITEGDCKKWRTLFKDIDLDVELEKMYLYLESAPKSKLPKASLPRFAMNWLQRCQKDIDKDAKISSRESRKIERRQAEDMAWLEELQAQPGGVSKHVLDQAKREMHQVFNKRTQRKRKKA
jgi:hypothetical protein